MSRYIDADVLCESLMTRWHTADENAEKLISEVMADIVTPIVVGIPTADVKPVVRGENLGGGAFLCSACGFDDVAHSHTVKFCPNCGAEIINARPADEDDSGLRK